MVVICFGTRPEVIKFSSVIKELSERKIPFKTVFTGQHKELFDDVSDLVPAPDYRLDLMKKNQTLNHIVAAIAQKLTPILNTLRPTVLLVQGDTTTAMTSALCAFNMNIPVGHVEAGLRTFNLNAPFPEEGNRQIISRIAAFNWAPTELSAKHLKAEKCSNVEVTGNTVVDMCHNLNFKGEYGNTVLITLHRRENFGEKMKSYFEQIETLAKRYPKLEFVFPMHPNPKVQENRHLLKHVTVTAPMGYFDFLKAVSKAKLIITDSGGVQEEAGTFKKRILLCRPNTERAEGVKAGFVQLVPDNLIEAFEKVIHHPEHNIDNPFGDGKAAERIVNSMINRFPKLNKHD